VISSPDPLQTRSVLADWIELTALFRGRAAGVGDLDSLSRINSDHDRERTFLGDGLALEDEIAEIDREQLSSRVSDEIGFRHAALGIQYPFEVQFDPLRVSLKRPLNGTTHEAYLFMLLMTAVKDQRFDNKAAARASIDAGRRLFHLCASVGVAGLLNQGRTYWFGFPRPTKTGFAAALADLCREIGFARHKIPPPPGLPEDPKDDQVDVIGWREFADRRVGSLFVVCQAATGNDWSGKSVANHLEAFAEWFVHAPYRKAMPSLAIPFPAHHEVLDPTGEHDFDTAVFNALGRLQLQHGVVLDRIRIVDALAKILEDAAALQRVGGFERIDVFKEWIAAFQPIVSKAA
jgi:hypothetical protein